MATCCACAARGGHLPGGELFRPSRSSSSSAPPAMCAPSSAAAEGGSDGEGGAAASGASTTTGWVPSRPSKAANGSEALASWAGGAGERAAGPPPPGVVHRVVHACVCGGGRWPGAWLTMAGLGARARRTHSRVRVHACRRAQARAACAGCACHPCVWCACTRATCSVQHAASGMHELPTNAHLESPNRPGSARACPCLHCWALQLAQAQRVGPAALRGSSVTRQRSWGGAWGRAAGKVGAARRPRGGA